MVDCIIVALRKTLDPSAFSGYSLPPSMSGNEQEQHVKTKLKMEEIMSTHKKPAPSVKAAATQTAANVEKFTKAGVEAARENIAISREEAARNQEKIVEASRDHLEQFKAGASEITTLGKQHLETLVETGKSVSETAKELHEQLIAETNELYSENVQFSKELLACRNLGDLAEVQSRAVQSNLTRFFDNTARLTDVWFKLATTAAEPISQQANQVAERLKKNLAA